MVGNDVKEAGSVNIKWILTVEFKITQNQYVPEFDHVMLKEVVELTEKEANLFLFDGGGRFITTSFTVDEELTSGYFNVFKGCYFQ